MDAVARRRKDPAAEDRTLAAVGPLGLVATVFAWLVTLLAGFALIRWAVRPSSVPPGRSGSSGSSITTPGLASAEGTVEHALAFVEAGSGLFVLTLLITYLPSVHAAFTRREKDAALLSVRVGDLLRAVEYLLRYRRAGYLDRLDHDWTA